MLKICLLNIAQWHEALHVLPIAAALSRRPGVEVHVGVATQSNCTAARDLCAKLGAGPVTFHVLWPSPLEHVTGEGRQPPKLAMLAAAAPFLAGFDAIVAPERTSLFLRRIGVRRPLLIHSDHGAGDRAVGFEPRLAEFDFALLAGEKQEARMLREGLVRPGHYRIVGYPKFEAAAAIQRTAPPLFAQARPTVLYNPHFDRRLGSWDRFGRDVLAAFAAQDRYNLIVAPHVRLAERRPELETELRAFAAVSNVHVDMGSRRSCDMTYVRLADIYLGDVSSQIYEFLERPRPCAFLDAYGGLADGDENAAHARFGPVADSAADPMGLVDAAVKTFDRYRPRQVEGFAQTFDLQSRSCSDRAAEAVMDALASAPRRRRSPTFGPARTVSATRP